MITSLKDKISKLEKQIAVTSAACEDNAALATESKKQSKYQERVIIAARQQLCSVDFAQPKLFHLDPEYYFL